LVDQGEEAHMPEGKGGETVLKERGREFYSEIGH
jgi:hypothetical protein